MAAGREHGPSTRGAGRAREPARSLFTSAQDITRGGTTQSPVRPARAGAWVTTRTTRLGPGVDVGRGSKGRRGQETPAVHADHPRPLSSGCLPSDQPTRRVTGLGQPPCSGSPVTWSLGRALPKGVISGYVFGQLACRWMRLGHRPQTMPDRWQGSGLSAKRIRIPLLLALWHPWHPWHPRPGWLSNLREVRSAMPAANSSQRSGESTLIPDVWR